VSCRARLAEPKAHEDPTRDEASWVAKSNTRVNIRYLDSIWQRKPKESKSAKATGKTGEADRIV
jgi:hypothetical protein